MRQDPVVANMLNTKKKVKKGPSGSGTFEQNKEVCDRCGRRHLGTCRHTDSICDECGEKGHIKPVCKNKGKRGNKSSTSTQREIVCTVQSRHFGPKETQATSSICPGLNKIQASPLTHSGPKKTQVTSPIRLGSNEVQATPPTCFGPKETQVAPLICITKLHQGTPNLFDLMLDLCHVPGSIGPRFYLIWR